MALRDPAVRTNRVGLWNLVSSWAWGMCLATTSSTGGAGGGQRGEARIPSKWGKRQQ